MGLPKWIGGILGWVSGGPIGALLGVLAGSAVEHLIEWSMQITDGSDTLGGSGKAGGYGRTGYGQASGYGRTNSGTYARTTRGWSAAEQRNSFFVSLLVLSSAVIKADGRTHPAELRTVQEFMRRNFGESAAQEAMSMLEQLGS
ncbi:MAG: TerB family tellurite resistance protein, partial [Bacteroidales bacterium]|nr:TerB family tellurite resistance protein [Bacteroidales bacterium]